MLEFYTSNYHKARKVHTCDLCNETINIGEKYHRNSGKYNDRMFDNKYHIECQNIIDKFCDENGDAEYDNDWIYDWLHENYCYACIHGDDNQDDCDKDTITCPLIREQLKENKNG